MSQDAELRCRCGEVRGRVKDASAETSNHVVCYCDDCQAFLHHLKRTDLLDEHGGTDVVQMAPAPLSFERGKERLAGVRLTPKGLHRWYASCCNTPMGNTMPSVPFVAVVTAAFERPEVFGAPRARIFGKYAIGTAPEGSTTWDVRFLARSVRLVLGWYRPSRRWPHPFFDRATRKPHYPTTILPRDAREALRSLCGPRP